MSKNRAFVVVLGLAVIVVSGLYLPWLARSTLDGNVYVVRTNESYAWLWSPPRIGQAAVIDWQRLLITWAVIAAAATCLFILMPYLVKSFAPAGRD
jgi:hypothetical protein